MAERAAPSAQVNRYTQVALADNTHRSYKADLAHFRAHGGTIPTTAIKLAEYLASFADTLAVATLQHRLIAIHRAHLEAGHTSPAMDSLVKRTMQGIRRTKGTAQRRVKALVKEDIIELVLTAESIFAIGQLLAHASVQVETGELAQDTVEALGWLLAELGDAAAACVELAAPCRHATVDFTGARHG